jgi:hypothetical protein
MTTLVSEQRNATWLEAKTASANRGPTSTAQIHRARLRLVMAPRLPGFLLSVKPARPYQTRSVLEITSEPLGVGTGVNLRQTVNLWSGRRHCQHVEALGGSRRMLNLQGSDR